MFFNSRKEPRTVRQDYPDFDDHHQLMEKRGRRSTAERSATEEYVTERINEILNQENSNSGEGGDAETFNWIANLTECEAGAGLEEEENIRFASWENITEEELAIRHPELGPGGSWKPLDCVARNKIAVIIPYRNRHEHLITLLSTLIPLLQRQKLDFRFIVTEQVGTELFNKGRIMNAAFVLAEKLGVDCVIFHDVDMIPEKLNVPYGCPDRQVAMHMGAYLDEFNYTQPYEILVGGVLALNVEDYISVNGYSNLYWGWGAEDDDMGQRLLIRGINISRVDERHHYTMLKHKKRGEEQDFQLE
uniref:Beta-1,4-N-acetylgalactosaminyltransferase n=1 Tax=Steinernema glaseri TaxID=37863 RepID=A0A1I7ZK10_9BILA